MRRTAWLGGVAIWLWASAGSAASSGRIEVRVEGAKSDRGQVRCTIYRKADGFPSEPGKAIKQVVAPLNERRATCVFEGYAPGIYAVAVLHDADGNGKMKKNAIGMPREGWAVSNNADARAFGPPRFDDARFRYVGKTARLRLKLRY